jgi:hypothetical protein
LSLAAESEFDFPLCFQFAAGYNHVISSMFVRVCSRGKTNEYMGINGDQSSI